MSESTKKYKQENNEISIRVTLEQRQDHIMQGEYSRQTGIPGTRENNK